MLNKRQHKHWHKASQHVYKLAGFMPSFKTPPFQWPQIEIPPEFPLTEGGRLPGNLADIRRNRDSGTVSLSESRHSPRNTTGWATSCIKKLKICLFFDGTNNNEKADKIVSGAQPLTEEELNQDSRLGVQAQKIKGLTYPRTTHVVRLYHACMGMQNKTDYCIQ